MRLHKYFFGSLMIAGALLAQQTPPADFNEAPDEPGRAVARISVLSGDASVRRSDSGDWVAAVLNAPLLAGDSLSVGPNGAAEVQFDFANFMRMAGDSEVRISEFDNGRQQVQLAKGLITWRVLRDSSVQTEISTPVAAVRPLVNASVRVEVAPDGATRVTVRHGEAEVYTDRGTERVREGNAMFVRGDSEYQISYATPRDQWDAWNDDRDAYLQRAQSPRYVSQDVYGSEDLDNYGRWDYDSQYGNVWMPNVASSWAPYQDGQWSWEPYYGWTWIDASPWGWAPFHYGSWYRRPGFGWAWFPGRRYDRAWWRPAMVAFVGFGGGSSFSFGFSNIGWVPLAPNERYRPWYGRGWNNGRNISVTNINIVRNTNVTNVYRNARYGGVTAVSAVDFQRGNFRNRTPVDPGRLQQASLVRGQVPLSPGAQHMRFADRPAPNNVPRTDLSARSFYSRTPSASGGLQQRGGFSQSGNPGGFNRGNTPAGGGFDGGRSRGMTTNPAWQSFGTPQGDAGGRQFGGRVNTPGADSQQRFPQQIPQQQVQPQRERQSGNRGGFFSGPREVQVAPPIVQERQQPAPRVERPPGNNSSFGAPRPSRGFDRLPDRGDRGGFRQQQSAPPPQAAPAPQFRNEAPRQAPSFRGGESPRPQFRGGGEGARPTPRENAPQRGGEGGGHGGGPRRR